MTQINANKKLKIIRDHSRNSMTNKNKGKEVIE